MENRLKARYLIETSYELDDAAQIMAGEQSSGTFLKIPGETEELKAKHAARVEFIRELEEVEIPSLPGAKSIEGNPIKRAIVELSWPYENFGCNLVNLCATAAGNLFELKPFSALKLLDLDIPEILTSRYSGPQFGIEGTRKITNIYDRPIIGTIIKPSVGLTPDATVAQVSTLIEAGLDFIKDDELMGDSPHSPFEERVDKVMEVINSFAQAHGKKPMFAFNISGDIDDMLHRHDYVLEKGGTCVMVSLNWVGISGTVKLADHTQLPIHGHRNGYGLFSRSEAIGIGFSAYQKIWRMAGVDHIHTNGLRNKFCESDESVIQSVKECLTSMFGGYEIMPVLSSGQWAGQAVDTYEAVNSVDLMYVCGGGIVAHPSGIAAGVKSIVQAWEAAIEGIPLEAHGKIHNELKEALEYYG